MTVFYCRRRKRWRVQLKIGGKRVSKDLARRDEAEEHSLAVKRGRRPERKSENITFEEFTERWLKDYCEVEKAESQWKSDGQKIRRHLTPALGSSALRDLRKSHLADVKVMLNKKGLAPQTVNNLLGLAKKMLATAVEWDLLAENPWRGVRPLKVPQRTFDFWTRAELEAFQQKAMLVDPDMTRLVVVAFHTGLRAGELGALLRQDLDFEGGQVRVRATLDLNTGARYERTKNAKVQWVPLNSPAKAALEPARFLQEGSVFKRDLFWNICKRFKRLALVVGSRPIRFHDLRHSFASNLAMAGVDLMVIQRLMRHASYQMTLRYAHLHPEHKLGITEVLAPSVHHLAAVGEKLVRPPGLEPGTKGL